MNRPEDIIYRIGQTLLSWIHHPEPLQPQDNLSSTIESSLVEIFNRLSAKARQGSLDPRVRIELLRNRMSSDPEDAGYHEKAGWIKLGVLGTVVNPLTWGHLLLLIGAFDILDLDVATILVHGAILHKPCEDAFPESARLHMAEMLIRPHLEPVIRFSDIGSGVDSGKSSEEVIQHIFKANPNRKIVIHALSGFERYDIFKAKLSKYYYFIDKYQMMRHPNRKLIFNVVGRFSKTEMPTEFEMDAISAELAKEHGFQEHIAVHLYEDIIDLGTSSSLYRKTIDPRLVPSPLHQYIVKELIGQNLSIDQQGKDDLGD